MSKTSDLIRMKFGATDAKRDEGLTTPNDIIRFDNILYGSDEVWQILDVYRPKEAEGRELPVIVSVHGGGWVYGDKEKYQFYCMDLAERGFAVVNYTYRLAPEHKFPAALEDTCMIFDWVLKNADQYGFDTGHIFAVGDSAGAHTLELFCVMCSNESYRRKFPFQSPEGFIPEAVALNCGVNVVKVSDRPEDQFSTNLMADYLENKGTAEELALVNVVGLMTDKFPPVFMMTAENDFLKYDVPPVVEEMVKNNVPFTVRYYKDDQEKLGHVFHLNIRSAAAKRCNDEECAWFMSFVNQKGGN